MEDMGKVCCESETILDQVDSVVKEETKKIKVRRKINKKKSATLQQMMVESATSFEYYEFDKNKITDSLVRETGIDPKEAKEIASIVEKKLFDAKMETPSTGLIREVINTVLMEKGHKKELDSYNNISMSVATVNELIRHHNFENSNTGFSPESVNLMIAGQALKQYAMKSVFSKDIADAHIRGEIHLHDGDFINRPYAFDGIKSILKCRYKDSKEEFNSTIYDLFSKFESATLDNIAVISYINNIEVMDIDGWTDIMSIIEINEEKDIYEVELNDGSKIYVTEDHPCIIYNNGKEEIQTKDIKIGDLMYVKK